MKKLIYLPLLLLVLFISVNKVKADTTEYLSTYYDTYDFYHNIDTQIVDNLVSYYNSNYSTDYPYYLIYKDNSNVLKLSALKTNLLYYYSTSSGFFPDNISVSVGYQYNFDTSSYSVSNDLTFYRYLYYSSNTNFSFVDSRNCSASIPSRCVDSIQLPSYSNLDLNVSYPQMDISNGDIIPTYLSLVNGPTADFTEVNLSNYDYIILSLKNYNQPSFNTTIYSLGSLCFTPVYNYGMTQKNEIFTGYQTMGCTDSYTSITPVSIYIIQADLDNHAVYYIKKSNSSSNIVKIPTSVFDITYITSENVNDPQVLIGGRSYPVIPFNDLTDTANKSTDEGYISGQVCSLGDVNCQATQNGMDISELFTQPLQVLKTLWGSITNVFMLITTFIGLLPITLQAFLYSAFMLAIILGILKIIL